MAENKKKPIEKFRAGSIEVAVWENEGKDNKWLSISHKKGYKDKETGEWKDSQTYGLNDLPTLVMLLAKAFEFGKTRSNKEESS